MPNPRFRLLALALPLAACGCASLVENLTGLYRVQQGATIGDASTIVAPDTVARGVAFDVRYTSFEQKCAQLVREDHSVRGDSVLIQSVVSVLSQCGDALQYMSHVIPMTVTAAGAYRIYVSGRKERNGYVIDTAVSRPLVVR